MHRSTTEDDDDSAMMVGGGGGAHNEVAYHQLTYENELIELDHPPTEESNSSSSIVAPDVNSADEDGCSTEGSAADAVLTDEQRARAERRARKRARRIAGVTVHVLAGLLLLSLSTRFIPSSSIESPLLRGTYALSPARSGHHG
jgi:hypothetical protein